MGESQLAYCGNRFELSASLAAGADNGRHAGIAAREVFRGYSGGGAGAELAHVVGFDQGEQFTGGHFIEWNQEP